MASNNANNNPVNGPRGAEDRAAAPPPNMFWKLLTNAAQLVVRFYLVIFLWVYHFLYKIFNKAIQPLDPIISQVRKVPKKDISVEGIFYQFLRLQFLIVLYFSPFVIGAFNYLTQPIVWAKNWLVDFVGDESLDAWKRTDPTVLKEG